MKSCIYFLVAFLIASNAYTNEDHDHHDEEHNKQDHHEEIQNSQVGPNKGILVVSEEEGIKLSPEAEKNFDLKKLQVGSGNLLVVPKTAIVKTGLEVNIYRYREGFYRRIDFEILKKIEDKVQVRSKDLKNGDQVVITGLGFLRIAELAAFGGAVEGHSH